MSFDEIKTNGKLLIPLVVSPSTMLRTGLSNALLSEINLFSVSLAARLFSLFSLHTWVGNGFHSLDKTSNKQRDSLNGTKAGGLL